MKKCFTVLVFIMSMSTVVCLASNSQDLLSLSEMKKESSLLEKRKNKVITLIKQDRLELNKINEEQLAIRSELEKLDKTDEKSIVLLDELYSIENTIQLKHQSIESLKTSLKDLNEIIENVKLNMNHLELKIAASSQMK